MKAMDVTEKTVNMAHCDWIIDKARELKALLAYDSAEMVVANKTRALTGIETMMSSLNELKYYVEELCRDDVEHEVGKDVGYLQETAAEICGMFEEILEEYGFTISDESKEGGEDARICSSVLDPLVDRVVERLSKFIAQQNNLESAEQRDGASQQLLDAAVGICDLFEDILEEFDITIPDECREGEEEEARLYGSAYYSFEDGVVECLEGLKERVQAQLRVVDVISDAQERAVEPTARDGEKELQLD